MAQGNGVPEAVAGPEVARVALVAPVVEPAAAGAVDAVGHFAEEEAAGHLLVELAEGVVVLQEVPQTGAGLQQQAHKLGLVADQGGEHGPVEVARLDGKKLVLCLLFYLLGGGAFLILPTFHWLSSVKISVLAMSTLFQAMASSSCLFQLSLPKDSLVLEAELMRKGDCHDVCGRNILPTKAANPKDPFQAPGV